ncbi:MULTISPECIES: TolB family protein [Streptomyces]|uniref:TolB family protein n=1 Tax=Streptomyces TaxID=1883 RepID=UPI00067BA3A2|nr:MULTISPECIES: PD40 domain-containing protein [Streptomyces]
MRSTCSTVRRLAAVTGVCALAALLPATTAAAQPAPPSGTERASVAADGTQGNGGSSGSMISADGRFAVFDSDATNLVPGDTNGQSDIFVKDLRTGAVERVNVASDGTQADSWSSTPTISADGRYVAFASDAAHLVPGDTNAATDIFVHDRRTGRTESVTLDGRPPQGKQGSQMPVISANGRYVAFASSREDLVPGDTNKAQDIFVRDRKTGTVGRVSVSATGEQANGPSANPVISYDGRTVGFISKAANLRPDPAAAARDRAGLRKPHSYPFYVHDLDTGRTGVGSLSSTGETVGAWNASISPDGRYAVFSSQYGEVVPGHPTGRADLFVRDLVKGTTEQMSYTYDGKQPQTGSSGLGVLSADNGRLYFESSAPDLVRDDTNNATDIFVRDMRTGVIERVNRPVDSTPDQGWSSNVSTDATGLTAAFDSDAANLVPGDTNGVTDVFVRRMLP